MKKLIVVLVILAGLGTAGELAAENLVESQIERAAAQRTRQAMAVDADVRSFPMVTRLAATGEVRRLVIDLDEVTRQRLTFANFTFDFRGIEIDRTALLRREFDITDVDSVTITTEIHGGPLSQVLGTAIEVANANFSVSNRNLVVEFAGREFLRLPLPGDLLPCDADADVRRGTVVISCTIHHVPIELMRTLGLV